MSMLLLVRSAEDVPCVVEVASEFLVYQRQGVAAPREADEVPGIWLRREIEAGVGIRESFSLWGLWTLCRVDGRLLRTEQTAAERRRTILDPLLGTTSSSQSSSATGTFFPVFAAADAVESIKAAMRELQDPYPQIIGGTWFVDDRERGIVRAQEAAG